MLRAKVMEIGKNAISPEDDMLILFDESATESLQEVAVIQKFEDIVPFEMKSGVQIMFGDQQYTVEAAGKLTTEHLNALGHITILFQPEPDKDSLLNGVYVTPYKFPEIQEGMIITYK